MNIPKQIPATVVYDVATISEARALPSVIELDGVFYGKYGLVDLGKVQYKLLPPDTLAHMPEHLIGAKGPLN